MNKLVYSTDHGRMCPGCHQPVEDCICKQQTSFDSDGIIRVQKETKGRRGKTVTIISGIPLQGSELKQLAKELKNKCGSGGSIKNNNIEIQGDHCDDIIKELQKKGWSAKRVGG